MSLAILTILIATLAVALDWIGSAEWLGGIGFALGMFGAGNIGEHKYRAAEQRYRASEQVYRRGV